MEEQNIYLVIHQITKAKGAGTAWVEMIQDMVDGLGYSYSRIARRIGVSPSTIQKLATFPDRHPRQHIFTALANLYYKLFYSEHRLPQAEYYLKVKNQHQIARLRYS